MDKLRAKLDRQIDKGSAKAHVALSRILRMKGPPQENPWATIDYGGINRDTNPIWRPFGGKDPIKGLEGLLQDDLQRSLKAQADKAHKTLVAINSKKGET